MSMMIQPVNGAVANTAAVGVREPIAPQRPESAEPVREPVVDEYVPEEKQEPSGRYWLETGEDGQRKIHFDDPEKEPAETCTGNTDRVDREIESLKRKRDELARQIERTEDPAKAKALEKQLAQVERELSQKDNDAYRRRNTVFS